MPAEDDNGKPRATRVVWEQEFIGPDVDAFGNRSIKLPPVIRRAPNYLELGRYFLKHPPKGKEGAFQTRDLPGKTATALLTYRRDVENWVMMEMTSAISQDLQFEDGALFKQTLRKLEHKEWDSGVAERGFFLVQPVPGYISSKISKKETPWQLRAIGKDYLPNIEAHKIGLWRVPEPDEFELIRTRLILSQFRSYVTNATEAAIAGSNIGQLTPSRTLAMIENSFITAKKMLPPASEEEEEDKKERVTRIPLSLDD